jgi:hypothetical protein
VKSIQEEVCQHLQESYAKYKKAADKGWKLKIFQEGDLVIVYLGKGCLPTGTSGKLKNKKYGLCKILRKSNENAYIVDLPEDLTISLTFNVADIFEYFSPEETELNSRTSSLQEGEIDAGHYIRSQSSSR